MSHIFNAHNVCVDPNTPINYKKDNFYNFQVSTAQSPNGRWDSSIYWSVATSGGGGLPRLIESPDDGFPSERDAILFALDRLKDNLSRFTGKRASKYDAKTARESGKMLAEIERQQKNLTQPQVFQQSLFDNF